MSDYVDNYWNIRLEEVKAALEDNNFKAHVVANAAAARELVLNDILPALAPASMSWGGSGSFKECGLYEALKPGAAPQGIELVDIYDTNISPEEKQERRRRALLVDLYFTGTNAVTESGLLVNLDMVGNRIAALTFGPRNVVVICGRNKLVHDVEQAIDRIKTYAAPTNAMRLNMKTPCVKKAVCQDCKSPERICNTWTITEKSFPEGRVIVVLVNEDLGL